MNYIAIPGLKYRTRRVVAAKHSASVDDVLNAICEKYALDRNDLCGHNRAFHLVFARQLCFLLLRRRDLSLNSIGKVMNRNHTTVLHGITIMQNYLDTGHERSVDIKEMTQAF